MNILQKLKAPKNLTVEVFCTFLMTAYLLASGYGMAMSLLDLHNNNFKKQAGAELCQRSSSWG